MKKFKSKSPSFFKLTKIGQNQNYFNGLKLSGSKVEYNLVFNLSK